MLQLKRPSDPDQFQDIVLDLFNALYGRLDFELWGRKGQKQDGIDVVNWKLETIVQCGLKDINRNNVIVVKELKLKLEQDLASSIGKHSGKFQSFYLASTFSDDVQLQTLAQQLSTTHSLDIQYWGWNRISKEIEKFPELFQVKYPHLYLGNNPDVRLSVDKKYLAVPDYISRTIKKAISGIEDFASQKLIDLIEQEDAKIVLLAYPGMGKSKELEQLAHVFSHHQPLQLLPLYCRLNHYKGNLEELLSAENVKWKYPESSYLLLLFDAMDEIPKKYIEDFKIDIERFCAVRKNAKIIISCRNNFYRLEEEKQEGLLKGFQSFLLQPFSTDDINSLLASKWNYESKERFLQIAEQNKINDLLINPYYLIKLSEIFEKNSFDNLPLGRAEILEHLINVRIHTDKVTRGLTGEELRSQSVLLKKSIEKIAISIETLGRNILSEEDFQNIETDNKIRELLKHSFLFNKQNGSNENWQFEHNNIQEYLAAKVLSRQSFETIKKYVSYQPRHNFIVPTWANTLNLLVSVLDLRNPKFESLVSWMIEIEPGILVRSEYFKFELETRQEIFKRIFNNAKAKSIWIDRSHFNIDELAKFSGGGKEIVQFLIKEIKERHNHQSYIQAIILLGKLENAESLIPEITPILAEVVVSKENNTSARHYGWEAASRLKVKFEEFTPKYLKEINFKNSSGVRTGVYAYFLALSYCEKYLQILLEGIRAERNSGMARPGNDFETDDREEIRYGSESLYLGECLTQIKDGKLLYLMLDSFYADDLYINSYSIMDRTWELIVNNCINAYDEEKRLLQKIIDLTTKAFSRNHNNSYIEQFKRFADETNTSKDVFDYCIEKVATEWYHYREIFLTICNDELQQKIVDLYKKGQLNGNQIRFGRTILARLNESLHDQLQEMLLKDHGDEYQYQETVDWGQINKAGHKKDLELLFNKEKFLAELYSAFDGLGKEYLTFNDVWNNYRKNEDDHSGIIRETLLDYTREGRNVTRDALEKLQNDEQWEWFTISNLFYRQKNDAYYEITETQKKWIVNWCFGAIDKAKFKESFYVDEYGKIWYLQRDVFLVFYFLEYNLDFGEEKELEMLWYDYYAPRSNNSENEELKISKLLTKLIDKYGQAKIKGILLENIEHGTDNYHVYMPHFRICKELGIKEATDYVSTYFSKSNTDVHSKRELIEIFEKLDGNFTILESFLPNDLSDEYWDWGWTLVEFLIKSGSVIAKEKMNQIIAFEPRNEDNQQLKIASLLVVNGHIEGLVFLLKWVEKFKHNPEEHITLGSKALIELNKKESVGLLLKYFELANKLDFKQRRFDDQYNHVFEALLEIGKSDDMLFERVHSFISNLILSHNTERNKHIMGLHTFISELESRYYINKNIRLELEDVLKLNKMLV